MKVLIALCAFAFIAAVQGEGLGPAQILKLREYYDGCMTTSKAEKYVVDAARNGQIPDDNAPLDFFLNCLLEKTGIVKDGKLQKQVLRSKLPSEFTDADFETVYGACSKADNQPKEKTARVAYKCFLVESPHHIQLIQI